MAAGSGGGVPAAERGLQGTPAPGTQGREGRPVRAIRGHPWMPRGRSPSCTESSLEVPGGGGVGQTVLENSGLLGGSLMAGEGGKTEQRAPGRRWGRGGDGGPGPVGVSGETAALPTLHLRPPRRTFKGRLGTGSPGRVRVRRGQGQPGCSPREGDSWEETRCGRSGKRLGAAGGATPRRRGGAGETKVSKPSPLPSPQPLCAQTQGG